MGTLFTYTGDEPAMPTLDQAAIVRMIQKMALACAWAEYNAQGAAQDMCLGADTERIYTHASNEFEGYSREAALLWQQLQRITRESALGEIMTWAYLEVQHADAQKAVAGEG